MSRWYHESKDGRNYDRVSIGQLKRGVDAMDYGGDKDSSPSGSFPSSSWEKVGGRVLVPRLHPSSADTDNALAREELYRSKLLRLNTFELLSGELEEEVKWAYEA